MKPGLTFLVRHGRAHGRGGGVFGDSFEYVMIHGVPYAYATFAKLTPSGRGKRVYVTKRGKSYFVRGQQLFRVTFDIFNGGAFSRIGLGANRSGRSYTYSGLDTFTLSYIETALWSTSDGSTPSGGEPLDKNYSITDIPPGVVAEMERDTDKFREKAGKLLDESGLSDKRAGHLFWLSRNGHGDGFWNEPGGKVGDALHKIAKKFGEYNLYVGDDSLIYGT